VASPEQNVSSRLETYLVWVLIVTFAITLAAMAWWVFS